MEKSGAEGAASKILFSTGVEARKQIRWRLALAFGAEPGVVSEMD